LLHGAEHLARDQQVLLGGEHVRGLEQLTGGITRSKPLAPSSWRAAEEISEERVAAAHACPRRGPWASSAAGPVT
jgi:hypothetical protein